VTSYHDEVCLSHVVDPVQQKLPEVVDTVANFPFSFKSNFLYLAINRAVSISPASNRIRRMICKSDRGSSWLTDYSAQQRRWEEAVDADGKSFLDFGWLLDKKYMFYRLLIPAQK
jgi:hypothetical protein